MKMNTNKHRNLSHTSIKWSTKKSVLMAYYMNWEGERITFRFIAFRFQPIASFEVVGAPILNRFKLGKIHPCGVTFTIFTPIDRNFSPSQTFIFIICVKKCFQYASLFLSSIPLSRSLEMHVNAPQLTFSFARQIIIVHLSHWNNVRHSGKTPTWRICLWAK